MSLQTNGEDRSKNGYINVYEQPGIREEFQQPKKGTLLCF